MSCETCEYEYLSIASEECRGCCGENWKAKETNVTVEDLCYAIERHCVETKYYRGFGAVSDAECLNTRRLADEKLWKAVGL